MDRMAEQFAISRRSLFRHLEVLRLRGFVRCEVRRSSAMRSESMYPIYRVHPRVPYDIDYWASYLKSESANLALGECQNGTSPYWRSDPSSPVAPRVSGPSDPLACDTEVQEKKTPEGVRRLRRRVYLGRPTIVIEEEDVVTPPRKDVGRLPGAPLPQPRKGSPNARLATWFEQEWEKVRTARPDLARKMLPMKPWNIESKSRCLAWIRDRLLPACSGDEELAKRVISKFCTQVIENRIMFPPHTTAPVHSHLGRHLDQILRTVRALEGATEAELDEDMERRREAQRAARRAR